MNRKNTESNDRFENGEYAVTRSRRTNIIAAVVCLLLAFLVWMVVMNAHDTAYLPVEITGGRADTRYVLSITSLEVKGTVNAIKRADRVVVRLPAEITTPGTYVLTEQNLIFPDGVRPVGEVYLTVTVAEP